ncbi:protein CUSTOS-like [Diorhabda sublineata]|uniref:protein CUSTOS-like n=1 Tax=Diorhabda sublineata TaxID=1163346 RepID=UPI0024E09E4C|nr:protein CUSTOS-like [Diorhabda sublineata]
MSSDSSDEDLALIREAQDPQFFKENLYSSIQESKEKLQPVVELASLRKTVDENEQFNFLKVTPEFQKYVAKQLSFILDKQLEKNINYAVEDKVDRKKKKTTSGVKLFYNSDKLLKAGKSEELPIDQPVKKFVVKRNILVKEEDLKSITVSGAEILSQKDIKYWSNRTKSKKLFNYKQDKNGTLQLVESKFIY